MKTLREELRFGMAIRLFLVVPAAMIGSLAFGESQIFNVFPGNAREPAIAISKERCASPDFKGGRAFVTRRGSGRAREACWDFLKDENSITKSIIVTCVLAGNIAGGLATDECYRVTVDKFRDVTLP